MNFEQLITIGGAWAWANFGKDIVATIAKKVGNKAKDGSEELWERFNWYQASKQYHKKIIDLYSQVRLLGKAEPVPLEGIFTDVFILDEPTALRRYDIDVIQKDPSQLESNAKRVNGLVFVRQSSSKRLFILGKPGAGKTTFLKYIALQAAQGKLNSVPIFVSLKEWIDWTDRTGSSQSIQLKPFLIKQFEICGFPDAEFFVDHLLERGQATVLFDGLDEVNIEGNQRAKVISELRDFSKQYDECPCLITCRIAATDYSFERFTYVEIADFNDDQAFTFVENWFRKDRRKLEMFARDFGKDENRGLRELATSPLLLTLLCLAFEATLSFPRRRVEIYEEALEALLKKWDASRGIKRDEIYRDLSLGRKRQMLSHIAAVTFYNSKYFIRQRELAALISDYIQKLPNISEEDVLDGEVILKAIESQHGILVERAHQIYSFSHLTFQEFFTAKYIVDNPSTAPLKELLKAEFLVDSRWREVILLTASMLSDADSFFKIFKRNIDEVISADLKLLRMLQWASDKASAINSLNKSAVLRALYCYLALLEDQFDNLDYSIKIMRDSDQVVQIDRVYSRDSSRENARASIGMLSQSLGPNVDDFTAEFDCDLRLVIALSVAKEMGRTDDYIAHRQSATLYQTFFRKAVAKCTSLSEAEFARQLMGLDIPTHNSLQRDWRKLEPKLRQLLLTHRNIGYEWTLNEDQVIRLAAYCRGYELFSECLKLAVVSDREVTETNILLPSAVH